MHYKYIVYLFDWHIMYLQNKMHSSVNGVLYLQTTLGLLVKCMVFVKQVLFIC